MQDITPIVLIVVFAAVVNIAVGVVVFCFPRRWLAKGLPMPVAMWVLLVICGLVATWGLLSLAISLVSKQPLGYSFGIAFGIFCGVGCTGFVVRLKNDKSAAGPLLLDCGPHPKKNRLLFFAVFLLLFGATGVKGFVDTFDIAAIVVMAIGVFGALLHLLMAFGRLQIREHGIWQYCELLTWNQLQSYDWEGVNNCSLRLQVKTLAFLGRGAVLLPAFPVPLEHKASIEESLQKYCPTTSDA